MGKSRATRAAKPPQNFLPRARRRMSACADGGGSRWGRRLRSTQFSQERTTPTPTLPQLGGGGFLRTVRKAILLALLLGVAGCAASADPAKVPEPSGFWTGPMHGAVPATIAGGIVVDSAALATLIADANPVLIDVAPMPHKPDDIAAAAWNPPPHRTIPGARWLPDGGKGALGPARDEWFRTQLRILTGHDRTRPIVFFCHPDCWASWNAAKRAILYGYTSVHWYEEGVEGWQDAGKPTEVAEAETPPF
ncbi:MAG TPA: rhodanese-like domain-containing protein [Dongiaceae bacterium]|nr:rhodanese-like domain-containing protein [Dongiaceae bacterium]